MDEANVSAGQTLKVRVAQDGGFVVQLTPLKVHGFRKR
jgi:hypothetical protein